MTDSEKFGLKPNAFHHLVTDDNAHIWAGMPETKKALGDVVRSALPDDMGASEFVILVGEFGGGKTHAMRYFVRQIRDESGFPFYISKSVQGDKNHFATMFSALMRGCGDDFFSELGVKISAALGKEQSNLGKYDDAAKAEILKKSGFSAEESDMALRMANDGSRKHLMDIKDDALAAATLASLIKVMTTPIGETPAPYPAAYLFIDEMEDMLREKPAPALSFWRACRELVNRIEGRCAMVWGFSEETAVLDSALPPALLERLTRPYIHTDALDDTKAKEFVKEFLLKSRLPGFEAPQPFYPFTEEAVDFILEREQALLPRRIIMSMGRVFKRGREKLDGEKEFSKEIAEEVFREMGL